MSTYNTFIAQATKGGKTILVTSSARKVKSLLSPGIRVEVWCENKRVDTIYTKTASELNKYIQLEREYIKEKQARAEHRNNLRRAQANDRKKR